MKEKQQQKQQIIKYLTYLKTVSKKIAQNTNFDSIFTKKPRGKDNVRNYFINDLIHVDYNKSLLPQLKSVCINKSNATEKNITNLNFIFRKTSEDESLKIFLGLNFVASKINKKVFSPWFYLECLLEKNDNDFIITPIPKLNINIESIISVMNGEILDEMTSNSLAEIIKVAEEKIDSDGVDLILNNIFISIFSSIKKICPDLEYEIDNNLISNCAKSHDFFNKSTEELKNTLFINNTKNLIFLSEEPNSLSTYRALEGFIKDVNADNLEENALIKLLENALNIKNTNNIDCAISFNDEEKKIFKLLTDKHSEHKQLLPLSLSKMQVAAIKNCFSNNISYIQGPPGTGKSHTITSLILVSLLLKKKILVVAQKPIALEAVKNKLDEVLSLNKQSNDLSLTPYILFDSNNKVKLKGEMQKVLNLLSNPSENQELLKRTLLRHDKLIKEINEFNSKYKKSEEELQNYLQAQSNFFEKNKEFIVLRDELASYPYNIKIDKEFSFPKETKDAILGKIKEIVRYYNDNDGILKKYHFIYLNKVAKYINKHYPNLDLLDKLKDNILHKFMDLFVITEDKFADISKSQRRVSKTILLELIKKELSINEQQEFRKSELIKTKFLLNFLQKINPDDLKNFKKLVHHRDAKKIVDYISEIKFQRLTDAYPVWLSEIRNISEVLPNQANLFDLVIVDEASQVNLAEILPVFYRGKHICIVGDHQQLGLDSTGLNFAINKKLDQIAWEKADINISNRRVPFNEAEKAYLVISKSSILDLVRSDYSMGNSPQVMLDEHYRSLPSMAKFNSKYFYNDEIKIMTETPNKIAKNCFSAIRVLGKKMGKINYEEAEKVIEIIQHLTKRKNDKFSKELILNDYCVDENGDFKGDIGIISYLRDQVTYIRERIEELDIDPKYNVVVGTPEELQGQERSLIIFSMVIDENSRNSAHYANHNRFNVAMSRAKYYTIFVYTEGATKPELFSKYLRYFKVEDEMSYSVKTVDNFDVLGWSFDESRYDSEFEKHLYYELKAYKESLYRKKGIELSIFNQVETCGQKRLDFVILNRNNNNFVAVEADGPHHYDDSGNNYADWHIDRDNILRKAGWNIINTPFHLWYKHGWIDKHDNRELNNEIQRIILELDKHLGVTINDKDSEIT